MQITLSLATAYARLKWLMKKSANPKPDPPLHSTEAEQMNTSKAMKTRMATTRQMGFSLMEVVVSMGLSLFVTAAMVALMSNSMGNAARVINMTKLSDDLRSTMQLMSRDVRRSSYNANALFCYGNEDCGTDGSVTLPADIVISAAADCFTFLLDRDHDGDSTENEAGGFRRRVENNVGLIEMWTGGNQPDCDAAAGGNWQPVTDQTTMNITAFNVDNSLSYDQEIFNDGVTTITQRVRKLRLAIGGELIIASGVNRRIEDVISVRNDLLQTS
jgi:prepilin peptidase dependent protein B